MRTCFVVLVLLVLALAAGFSFAVDARGQTPVAQSATLDFSCARDGQSPAVVPSGVTAYLTCTARARNTGTVAISDASLSFSASANLSIPDQYYFFRYSLNRTERPVGEGQLSYDFGEILPGGESEIVLGIIIQTSHEYGADVSLVAGADRTVLAHQTLIGNVTADIPEYVPVKFALGQATDGSAIYHLYVVAVGEARYDDVSVELATGTTASFSGGVGWTASGPGRFVLDGGALSGPSGELARELTFSVEHDDCAYVHPAVVVTAKGAGRTVNSVVIGEFASLGNCGGQGGGGTSNVQPAGVPPGAAGGAAAAGLPNTGTGPSSAKADGVLTRALIIVGIVLVGCALVSSTCHLKRRSHPH